MRKESVIKHIEKARGKLKSVAITMGCVFWAPFQDKGLAIEGLRGLYLFVAPAPPRPWLDPGGDATSCFHLYPHFN